VTTSKLTCADYPLAEKRPEIVKGGRGKSLDDITLEAVADGKIGLLDLSITAAALHQQAEIARDAGRETLALNFERAADLVDVPQDTIMRIYELLRPGRARSKDELLVIAQDLQNKFGATVMAGFIIEAAEVYEMRGLFRRRY
jgi:propanediol dehydratase small subunit